MLYPYSHLAEVDIERRVRAMSVEDRLRVIKAYTGDRSNRRHRPGRALERPFYRFDVLADYGAFRDLQRHRMLTVEWQTLNPRHGYTRPPLIDEAGLHSRSTRRWSAQASCTRRYEAISRCRRPMRSPWPTGFAST